MPARRFEPLRSSPLCVLLVSLGALGSWTCGYQAMSLEKSATSIAPPRSEGGDETSPETREPPPEAEPEVETFARAASVGRERGPRLRHEPSLDEPYGLPIALDDPDGSAMHAFHAALRRAEKGEGQARIVVYGASHVASDLFTGLLREELQTRFGDAGHGFVLPVHPWKSYRHFGVEVVSDARAWTSLRIKANSTPADYGPYGLAGVAVETTRAGAWGEVRTASRGAIGRTASSFEVFFWKQPDGGQFEVVVDDRLMGTVRTAAPVPEAGYATFTVEEGPHVVRIRTHGDGKVRLFGVAVEREQPGVVLDTLGINGARVRYHLLWEDVLYREHLKKRRPDLVVLAYGTNESGDDSPIEAYEADLRRVVARVRETVPEASCLLVGPSDRPVRTPSAFEDRPRTALVNEVQLRVAMELGCAYFDLVAFQGGSLSTVDWVAADPPYAAPDYIHFTARGYQRFGRVLLDAMLEGMSKDDPSAPPAVARGR